jgi:DNA-binding MarR family transcriptional regulator
LSNQFNLGLLMYVPYRAMESQVLADLAASGFDDITPAQAKVFQRIAEPGSRLTELAEAAQVTKQTAGFLVDQLVAAGYVKRVADPSDRRARLVIVAPRGRRAVAVAARTVARVERDWARHLGAPLTKQLRTALESLGELIDAEQGRSG